MVVKPGTNGYNFRFGSNKYRGKRKMMHISEFVKFIFFTQ